MNTPSSSLLTDASDASLIEDATYNWEFVSTDGATVLPGHLFNIVEIRPNSLTLEGLRSDADLSKYLGDSPDASIEGRCVASVPGETGTAHSDPFIYIGQDGEPPKPTYHRIKVIAEGVLANE